MLVAWPRWLPGGTLIHPKVGGMAPAADSGLGGGDSPAHGPNAAGGGAATGLTKELQSLTFSCSYGPLVTTAKPLAARALGVGGLGVLGRKGLKEGVEMGTGGAGRLLKAMQCNHGSRAAPNPFPKSVSGKPCGPSYGPS